MGSKKTISDRETIDGTKTSTGAKADEILLRELAEEASKLSDVQYGLPTNPLDYAWLGGAINGKRRLTDEQVSAFQDSDLGKHTALEQLLASIIELSPEVTFPKAKKLKNKSVSTYRLEQAMKFLTGKAPNMGWGEDDEDNLKEIAKQYFKASLELQNDQEFINRLILNVIKPSKAKSDLTSKQIEDEVKNTRKLFYKNFQRLMFQVSEIDSDEQIDRRRRISFVIAEVHDLIKSSRPKPVSYKSTDE